MNIRTIWGLGNFVRGLRSQMQRGELRNAIGESRVLFELLPDVEEAQSSAYRQSAREPPDLAIACTLCREAPLNFRVSSLAMRARLRRFRVQLGYGALFPPGGEEQQSLRMLSNE
jgi:hypothetical protein